MTRVSRLCRCAGRCQSLDIRVIISVDFLFLFILVGERPYDRSTYFPNLFIISISYVYFCNVCFSYMHFEVNGMADTAVVQQNSNLTTRADG